MLYFIIRLLAVLSLERFFHKVVVEYRDRIPEGFPTIFVANHPNTMIDAMVVGYAVGKRMCFLAKSTLFTNKIIAMFLSKVGMVPVFRRRDDPALMHKNEDVFFQLYEHLEKKGSFLIFPEGISEPNRRIQPLKTGAARIAFGVEERNDFQLGVQIIPVGLNYTDYQRFRSDVYCRFGRPITLSDFRERYEKDPLHTVRDLTKNIQTSLQKLTTHIEEESLSETVSDLETIYKKKLMVDLGMKQKSMKDDFLVTKGIIQAVEWFHEHQPKRMRRIQKKIRIYISNIERLHIKDEFLSPYHSGIGFLKRLKAWVFLVLGFPIYLWGIVHNLLPYLLPRLYVHQFIKQKTFISSVKLLVGLGSFLVFYLLQSWLSWILFHSKWITVLYSISLIPSGNFALYYIRKARNYRQHFIFLSLFYRRRILIYNLIRQRMRLIESINRARDEYFAATGTGFQTSQTKGE